MQTVQNHHELIAAETTQYVPSANSRPKATGDLHQHRITRGMTKTVVDQLETIKTMKSSAMMPESPPDFAMRNWSLSNKCLRLGSPVRGSLSDS